MISLTYLSVKHEEVCKDPHLQQAKQGMCIANGIVINSLVPIERILFPDEESCQTLFKQLLGIKRKKSNSACANPNSTLHEEEEDETVAIAAVKCNDSESDSSEFTDDSESFVSDIENEDDDDETCAEQASDSDDA